MVLIAEPILQREEEVYGYCGRWPENALVQLLEWLGPSKEARKDVVVLAPLHATGLGGLIRGQGYVVYLNLFRAATILGMTLEPKDYV